jgi:hypothetical protein
MSSINIKLTPTNFDISTTIINAKTYTLKNLGAFKGPIIIAVIIIKEEKTVNPQ